MGNTILSLTTADLIMEMADFEVTLYIFIILFIVYVIQEIVL